MLDVCETSASCYLGADPLTDQPDHLPGLGVAAQGRLGEDQISVERDFEATLRRRDQLDCDDDRGPAGKKLVRQTDGTRDVVSRDTELNAEAVAGIEHSDLVSVGGSTTLPGAEARITVDHDAGSAPRQR